MPIVDDVRIGRILRALRRHRGWRQEDLGARAGCSQTTISLVERGHVADLPLRRLRRVFGALDAEAVIDVRWRGGTLDRLLDERHVTLAGAMVEVLEAAGWEVQVEVSYAHYGERGSIDVLAWHSVAGSLLVVEVKSELVSVEATLRKLDEKSRLAAPVARERFGWSARTVSRLLVLPDASTERHRVMRAGAALAVALPQRGDEVRRWLRQPEGRLSGITFLPDTRAHAAIRGTGGQTRVRVPRRGTGTRQRGAPR